MIKQKGFTLIELLLVIAIVSLLSSISFFGYSNSKKKADDAHMKAEAAEVRKAIELYKVSNNGNVPTNTFVGGEMIFEGHSSGGYENAMNQLVPKYLSEVPSSPSRSSYGYMTNESGTEAVFVVKLNYPTQNSSQSNSCTLVQSGVDFDSCYRDHSSNLLSMYDPESQEYACLYDRLDYPTGDCSCINDDLEAQGKICYETIPGLEESGYCDDYEFDPFSFGSDLSNICSTGFFASGYHLNICNLPTGETCSGSSNTDYCTCI